MGNSVARLAYTNEATSAAWAVVGRRGLTGVPATPEAEAQLFLDVAAELRRQALGMPPGLTRTSLAAAVREVGGGRGRGGSGRAWRGRLPGGHVDRSRWLCCLPRLPSCPSFPPAPSARSQMTQGASSNPVAAAVQRGN